MTYESQVVASMNNFLTQHGFNVSIQATTSSYSGTEYDDEYLAGSGTTLTAKGIILPIGQDDLKYLEDGKIRHTDSKLYVAGSFNIASNYWISVSGTGITNITGSYIILPEGVKEWHLGGSVMFVQSFIRRRIE